MFAAFWRTERGAFVGERAICAADALTRRESIELAGEAAAEKAVEDAVRDCPALEIAWASWSVAVYFDAQLLVSRVAPPKYRD